jgi:hypothetical protein
MMSDPIWVKVLGLPDAIETWESVIYVPYEYAYVRRQGNFYLMVTYAHNIINSTIWSLDDINDEGEVESIVNIERVCEDITEDILEGRMSDLDARLLDILNA